MIKKINMGIVYNIFAGTALVVVLAMVLTISPLATYEQNPQIRIDREFVQIPEGEQAPLIIDGRTLVPLRAVMEALSFEVDWEPAPQNRATIVKPGYDISVTIGNNTMQEL